MFEGSYVALVTPFKKNGSLDELKLEELIEFQIKNGTAGIVPCGTTGESPTLSWEEHNRVIDITVKVVRKRVQVIAGTGSNNTKEAIEATQHAKQVGADAALVVNPYYNKPPQEGLFQHFKAVAEEGGLPIIVYNIPGRTGVNVTPQTLERLTKVRNISGVKESSGNLGQMAEMIYLCGDKLDFLSGDDNLTLPLLSIGGKGVVSVIANICPQETADLVRNYLKGNSAKAREIHYRLLPLCQSLFLETNPIPVKAAMNLLGMEVGACRLPLTSLNPSALEAVKKELVTFGLKKKSK